MRDVVHGLSADPVLRPKCGLRLTASRSLSGISLICSSVRSASVVVLASATPSLWLRRFGFFGIRSRKKADGVGFMQPGMSH